MALRMLPRIGEYIHTDKRMVEIVGVTKCGDLKVLDVKSDLDEEPKPETLTQKQFEAQGWEALERTADGA